MNTEYKGYQIFYDEKNDSFKFHEGGDVAFRNEKLSEVKNYIDKLLKKEFKRVPVIFETMNGEWVKAEVTSVVDDDFWIVSEKGNRQKKSFRYQGDYVYLNNEKNSKVIEQIKNVASQMAELQNKNDKLISQLERFIF